MASRCQLCLQFRTYRCAVTRLSYQEISSKLQTLIDIEETDMSTLEFHCPFDCCQVWKGIVPIPSSPKLLSMSDYLTFMESEKRKRLRLCLATEEGQPSLAASAGSTSSSKPFSDSGKQVSGEYHLQTRREKLPAAAASGITINLVACTLCDSFCLSENDLRKHIAMHHAKPVEIHPADCPLCLSSE